ncbi:hypothetical protein O6H91_06G138400 [Diphasiastrum complanatum]|uniref:Uncharacterized protein n=1 Tax=Diphasiastrum complanatum TaxID=34168 RepID=A0ACC2DJB0_DIPCM|nr:hypothetical protein O6H91_06G138400 [Diphasiastrum complanatum]
MEGSVGASVERERIGGCQMGGSVRISAEEAKSEWRDQTEVDEEIPVARIIDQKVYAGRTTAAVVLACVVAASGGFVFGYVLEISGGVASMDDFLKKFFPAVYVQKRAAHTNHYCKYDNQVLQAFISTLLIAGLISTVVIAPITRRQGRRAAMIAGGASTLAGSILSASAQNLPMLFIGRILLGFGVGITIQSTNIYMAEMAPAELRGGLHITYTMALNYGVLISASVNYGTSKIKPWGWRLSFGLTAVPAIILIVGLLLLPDTPNSLIERGYLKEGRAVLERMRGVSEVDVEFEDLVEASRRSMQVKHPFLNILQRTRRPQILVALLFPVFEMMTGANVLLLYAPVFFRTLGFGSSSSLYSTIFLKILPLLGMKVSICRIDRWGRRWPLIVGGFIMLICQVSIGFILGFEFIGTRELSKSWSIVVVLLMCIFAGAYACSWGSLARLISSEVLPLEIRSAGMSMSTFVSLLFSFALSQSFLSIFCHMRYGTFFFFGGWVVIMTIFSYFFLPETSIVPIELMTKVWENHPIWSKFVEDKNMISINKDVKNEV